MLDYNLKFDMPDKKEKRLFSFTYVFDGKAKRNDHTLR